MSTTHLVAISNQVRQRNECYKHFVKGFMLSGTQTKEWGKEVLNGQKRSKIFHFVISAMLKG